MSLRKGQNCPSGACWENSADRTHYKGHLDQQQPDLGVSTFWFKFASYHCWVKIITLSWPRAHESLLQLFLFVGPSCVFFMQITNYLSWPRFFWFTFSMLRRCHSDAKWWGLVGWMLTLLLQLLPGTVIQEQHHLPVQFTALMFSSEA